MIGAGEIFTLFFVTLGPLKVFGPFAARTQALELATARGIALRVFALSLAAVAIGGYIGGSLAVKWQVSLPALLLATGVIFFLVALRLVMEQYEPPHAAAHEPLPAKPLAAALRLTFPMVITPYGIAGLIALLAAHRAAEAAVWGSLLGVMVLNLLAMLFARQLVAAPGLMLGMRLLGAVLGVLQVALAVEIILRGLENLGVVAGT